MIAPDLSRAIEAARHEAHGIVDTSFDALLKRLTPATTAPTGTPVYKDPSDDDCRSARNKNGLNLSLDGAELLFRLLDKGAGYNSAARKLSITPSAVKNRKKEWTASGGANRKKRFIDYLDAIA